jgi:hypothetical protein
VSGELNEGGGAATGEGQSGRVRFFSLVFLYKMNRSEQMRKFMIFLTIY